MIQIELPNKPVPWAPSRITKSGAYNPKSREKNFTRWQIKSMYRGEPIDKYIVIDFTFVFPVPNSVPKSKRAARLDASLHRPTQSDCTNLQKFYEDCLKGIVITDDRNVAKISSEKIYGKKEKILIKVWTLEEYQELADNEIDHRGNRGHILHGHNSFRSRAGKDKAWGDD